jgi:hypothetical protein
MDSKPGKLSFLRRHFGLAKDVFSKLDEASNTYKLLVDLARKELKYSESTHHRDIIRALQASFHRC